MANEDTPDAPYGWDVIGSDGRRAGRWLAKGDADELAARIRSVTDEKVKVKPAQPRLLGPNLTVEDVRAEPEPEPEPEPPVDFDSLTVATLDEMAAKWDVDGYPKSGTKDEKVAALKAHAAA